MSVFLGGVGAVPFTVTRMCAVGGEKLVLAGRDTDLHVLDLRTMSMERVIHSGHTDWISGMDSVKQDAVGAHSPVPSSLCAHGPPTPATVP